MKIKEIDRIIDQFERHLRETGKNPGTIRSYVNDVRQFFVWLRDTFGEEFSLRDVSRSDILDFRGFLQTRRSSLVSVNRRVTSLRRFFEMCAESGVTRENPVSGVGSIPTSCKVPSILVRKDALLLLRMAEQSGRALDACVVLLLLHAGLRSSEICSASLGDLHLTPRLGRLFVRGQRHRTMRYVHLSTRSMSAMRRYMARRGAAALARRRRAEFLFVQRDGAPLSQQSLDLIVKRLAREAGIVRATPTVLRNTCAVQMLLRGDTPDSVKRALGVSSIRNHLRLADLINQGRHPY